MGVHPLFQQILDALTMTPDVEEAPVMAGHYQRYLARSRENLEPAFPVKTDEGSYAEYAHKWTRQMRQWVSWTLSDLAVEPEEDRYAYVILDGAATEQLTRGLTGDESRLLSAAIRDVLVAKHANAIDDVADRLHDPFFNQRRR